MSEREPISDDAMAELLGHVGDDTTLRPPDRDRARAAMLAEFDAIAARRRGSGPNDLSGTVAIRPTADARAPRARAGARRPFRWWPTAAAAGLVAVALWAVVELRDEPPSSQPVAQPMPIAPVTLPGVDGAAVPLGEPDLGTVLDDRAYRTDVIRDGISFSNAGDLRVAELRDGLLVLDSGMFDAVRARITVFEADAGVVDRIVTEAVDGDLLQADEVQFVTDGRSLRRRDLTVTSAGIEEFDCVGQGGCVSLTGADGEVAVVPSLWARSENFLVEFDVGVDDPARAVFVLVQSKTFGDPLLGSAFEVIDSIRFGDP